MNKKINYRTSSERDAILKEQEQKGYTLIEDVILLNEKYLVFDVNIEVQMAQNTAETLEVVTTLNELQKIEQAQANTELIELMMSLQGGN